MRSAAVFQLLGLIISWVFQFQVSWVYNWTMLEIFSYNIACNCASHLWRCKLWKPHSEYFWNNANFAPINLILIFLKYFFPTLPTAQECYFCNPLLPSVSRLLGKIRLMCSCSYCLQSFITHLEMENEIQHTLLIIIYYVDGFDLERERGRHNDIKSSMEYVDRDVKQFHMFVRISMNMWRDDDDAA